MLDCYLFDKIWLFHCKSSLSKCYSFSAKLVRHGAVDVLLKSLTSCSDDRVLLLHLSLLNKLAGEGTVNLNPQRICTSNHFSSSDKKFVIKARLSGTLPVIAAFLKRSYNDPSSLPVILSMVKTLAVNGNHVFPQLFCSHKLYLFLLSFF